MLAQMGKKNEDVRVGLSDVEGVGGWVEGGLLPIG